MMNMIDRASQYVGADNALQTPITTMPSRHLSHTNDMPTAYTPNQRCAAELSQVTSHKSTMLELFEDTLSYGEPTYVFIDGANFKAGCDKVNIDFDYRAFRKMLFSKTKLISARYYTAMTEKDNDKFVKWLLANGFQTFVKTVRDETNSPTPTPANRRKNIDAEMATDMAILPFTMPDVKHVILLSGDGDFSHTVKTMQDRGVRVTCISPSLEAGITARTLIKQVDFFVPLEDLVQEYGLRKQEPVRQPVNQPQRVAQPQQVAQSRRLSLPNSRRDEIRNYNPALAGEA